jgi:two-component system, OmpR family, alkaline phosphatase synthesis response regulator PhoP
MSTIQILVVDDDEEIVRLLQAYLEQADFTVLTAHDSQTTHDILRSTPPHLMILDLMLPDGDGREITRFIRSSPGLSDLPIIMLTAKVEDSDKLLGLELGSDDYITKPFNPSEVVARVRAILRRSYPNLVKESPSVLVCGKLQMDIAQHKVTVDNYPVDLTPTEYELLRALMENPGYLFSRVMLIERSAGHYYENMERVLDSHIRNLRKKIEPDPRQPIYIQTVYGVGYRLERQPK